jgi:bromodomain-containing protein 7/9
MCNNAMTYNSPETSYYQVAKNLLNVGMKMIQKVFVILFWSLLTKS